MYGDPPRRAVGNVRLAMQGVVEALEGVEDLEEVGFGEFRYREQLRDQLTRTFTHLKSILPPDIHDDGIQQLVGRMEKTRVGEPAGPLVSDSEQ
ncbi:hypothetical protein HK104_009875 [Borealophlyctis nickersoniae]|nr:hypothetical protein HK104_009875 [Borealophlyctis nickersoniae]